MPSGRTILLLVILFVVVGAASIYVSYLLAGAAGAGFMTFGVILASLLSIMGVGFNVYYTKHHARQPRTPERSGRR